MARPRHDCDPQIRDDAFPASFRTARHMLALPKRISTTAFLESDLSVKRLDAALEHLRFAGRPYLPRPLNVQLVLDRKIVATTEAPLHLVWGSGKIFIKALPRYLLSTDFYQDNLSRSRSPQPDGVSALALGLLYTYVALVPTELDFAIAQEHHLMPTGYTWEDWRDLAHQVLRDYGLESIYEHLPQRYMYGELRLSRLDLIWRFLLLGDGDWLHGYSPLTGFASYTEFLSGHLRSFGAAGAYIVIVLTAMQVALQASVSGADITYQRICKAFAMFSMIGAVVVVGVVFAVFLLMFIANWRRMRAVEHKLVDDVGIDLPRVSRRSVTSDSVPQGA